jgi:hypothetical protein
MAAMVFAACSAAFAGDTAVQAKERVPVLLKYDDGNMESKSSSTGGGHAVLFKCPADGDWYLDQVQLFGARYGYDKAPGENFFIYITDPKMEKVCKISKPYSTFVKGNEKWTTIKITPVKVPEEFYVCFVFNPTQTKGVFVGMDENVEESHSKEAVPGDHINDMPKKADWMIRAHITPFASGKPMQLLGKNEQENVQEPTIADREPNDVQPTVGITGNYGTRMQPSNTSSPNLALPSLELVPADARELIAQYERDKKPIQKEAQRKIRKLTLPLIASLKKSQDDYTREAKLDEAVAIRNWVRHLQQLAGNVIPNPGTLQNYNSQFGDEFNFLVTGSTNGAIWGTDVYTTDSALSAVAVHAGIIKSGETGVVKATILPGRESYQESMRNGVNSNSWQSFPASFKVERGNDLSEENEKEAPD